MSQAAAAAQPKSLHRQLNDTIISQLKELREIFFSVNLVASDEEKRAIVDPDPDIHCPLFNDRETFLTYCRAHFHEFSVLRLAQYSTSRFVEIVVRDQTRQHLKYFQTAKHVHRCLNQPNGECDLPECSKMKKRLETKDTNAVLRDIRESCGERGQSFQDAYLIIARNCLMYHMKTCPNPITCEENICRIAAESKANLH